MTNRRLHGTLGRIFAPFFILVGITAIPLFWRNDDVYSSSTKRFLVSLHTWEIAAKYVGVIMALSLISLSVSGLIMAYGKKRVTTKPNEPDESKPPSSE